MLKDLLVFSQSASLARHAGTRQALASENIANADTPGYRAKDIPDFELTQSTSSQRPYATRPGHAGTDARSTFRARSISTESENPNGNEVSLESEMVRAAEAERSHDMAMTLYSKSLDLLRMSLGGRR